MKNKLCYVILILVVSFSFIGNVFAQDLEFTLDAKADRLEVSKGSDAVVTINLMSDVVIANCTFNVESDEGIVYSSYESLNAWSANIGTKITVQNDNLLDTVPLTSGKNVLKLKYKVNNNGKLIIKNIECVSLNKEGVDSNGNQTEITGTFNDVTLDFTVTEVVEDTTLRELKVTNGTVNPSSISGTNISYIINLTSPTFGLTMTASDSQYQDDIIVVDSVSGERITDTSNITYSDPDGKGGMPLTITVNEKTSYSLLAVYVKKELDNSLSSIKINDETLDLTKFTCENKECRYKHTVASDVKNVSVAAVIKDMDNFKWGNFSPSNYSINDVVDVVLEVVPKDPSSGAESLTYYIEIFKEVSTNNGSSTGNTGSSNNNAGNSGNPTGNVGKNPGTSDISMYLMASILIISFIGSVVLYKKNLEGYK